MTTEKPSPEKPKTPELNKNEPKKPEILLAALPEMPKEHGGYESQGLLEPTRFGDWEVKGRCSDF